MATLAPTATAYPNLSDAPALLAVTFLSLVPSKL